MDRIYGSNRDYILNTIPHIGKLLIDSFEELAGWAEHLIVTQRQSPEVARKIRESGLPVFDLARDLR
jgi:hypothetical protein